MGNYRNAVRKGALDALNHLSKPCHGKEQRGSYSTTSDQADHSSSAYFRICRDSSINIGCNLSGGSELASMAMMSILALSIQMFASFKITPPERLHWIPGQPAPALTS